MLTFTCHLHGRLTHTEELCPGCLYLERKKIEAEPQDPQQTAVIQRKRRQLAQDLLRKLDKDMRQRSEGSIRFSHRWPEPYWKEYRGKLLGRVLLGGQPHARILYDEFEDTRYVVLLPWSNGMVDALERHITVRNGRNTHEYWVGDGGFDAIDPESSLQLARRRLLERAKVKERTYEAELRRERWPLEWDQEQEYERTM